MLILLPLISPVAVQQPHILDEESSQARWAEGSGLGGIWEPRVAKDRRAWRETALLERAFWLLPLSGSGWPRNLPGDPISAAGGPADPEPHAQHPGHLPAAAPRPGRVPYQPLPRQPR